MSSNTDTLTGQVVRRGDAGYESARLGWNQLHSRHPEAVVFCAETQDVVNALAGRDAMTSRSASAAGGTVSRAGRRWTAGRHRRQRQ